jgi:hypothetical protein
VATTGSSIATIPARVALMRRSEPTISVNGAIDPSTTIQRTSAHTGRWTPASEPWSETVRPTVRAGKVHHGCTTDQKSVAKKKPHARSEMVSRRAISCSAERR